MWVSQVPGRTDIYRTSENSLWRSRVIYSVTEGAFGRSRSGPWVVKTWGLEYNGERLVRVKEEYDISAFDGERHRSGLILEDNKEPTHPIAKEQIRLGGVYWDLLHNGCRWHSGTSLEFPYNEVCQRPSQCIMSRGIKKLARLAALS